jgi:hypothetical protein
MVLVRVQPIPPDVLMSVSYRGQIHPSFQRGTRVRFPSRMPRALSRRCRIVVNTSVSPTENAGSIPVTDSTPSLGSQPIAASALGRATSSFSGCSSVAEHVAWDDGAAGAIPATQTHRHRPKDGTRDYESRWLGFESSRWLETPGCSSAAERVGDNHDVTGAIPVIQTKIDRFDHTTVPWRDTILRRSLAEVRILSVVPLHTSPSGTVLDSKSGEAVFDSLATCFARTPAPGRRVV